MKRPRAPAKATGAAFILQPPTGSPPGTATILGSVAAPAGSLSTRQGHPPVAPRPGHSVPSLHGYHAATSHLRFSQFRHSGWKLHSDLHLSLRLGIWPRFQMRVSWRDTDGTSRPWETPMAQLFLVDFCVPPTLTPNRIPSVALLRVEPVLSFLFQT